MEVVVPRACRLESFGSCGRDRNGVGKVDGARQSGVHECSSVREDRCLAVFDGIQNVSCVSGSGKQQSGRHAAAVI